MNKLIFLILSLILFSEIIIAQKSKKTTKKGKSAVVKTTTPKSKVENVPSGILSQFENEILIELNLLRSNPQNYVQYLEEMKKSFTGKTFKNSQGVDIVTFEGVKGVDEAIVFLKTQTPVNVFQISKVLTKASKLHLQDMIDNNFFGHLGSNQSMPNDRAGLFGKINIGVTQNLTEGSNTPREIVLQMLVSDGQTSRNQRKNLFNPQLKVIGVSAGAGKKGFLCVLVLAGAFDEKG